MVSQEVTRRLAELTGQLDQLDQWPAEQLDLLARENILGWVIPPEYGGSGVSSFELVQAYEQLADACLTTTFILTQFNAACRRIVDSENETLKARLMPELASGRSFNTIGISHLTTSRQHLKTPAVLAEIRSGEICLNGNVPWVTGAAHADFIVTGGTCEDGRQILLALPTDQEGVVVQKHAQLMALTSSHTASVAINNVVLSEEFLLAGPAEAVMKQGSGGAGSLTTSTLALGLTVRALKLIQEQAAVRPDLKEVADQFDHELRDLRESLHHAIQEEDQGLPQYSAAMIRQRANSLVTRVTQAAMAVSKGAGFVRGHPAERAVREAMFFLVWSCPQPVVQRVLEELACREGF